MRHLYALAAAFVLLTSASAGSAQVSDPAGDLIGTYTGPSSPDLDILSADVAFDGSNFFLSTTLDGTVGTTAGSLFVWGVDRGSGTPRLTFGSPSVGTGVLFDAVIVMFPDGTLRVVTIPLAGAPTISQFAGGTIVNGDTLSATVSSALLGSMGFAPEAYNFSLWSRARVNPAMDGTNAEIADFLAGTLQARAVPEPATWLMMLLGFGLSGAAIRLRKRGRQGFRQPA
jgi:hypothetical protein